MVEAEEPSRAARREALGELGLRLDALEYVGRLWPSPGVSAEQVTLFLAPYATDRINDGGGVADEHEGIVVVERPLATLAADADGGRIVDLKLLTLILTLRAVAISCLVLKIVCAANEVGGIVVQRLEGGLVGVNHMS